MKFLKENIEQKSLGRLIEHDEHARRKVLVEAWKGTGYLYGLKGRDIGNMATLMESQKRQILKENNTTADMAIFDTIAIPMIRRQNALMVSPNLISVQPLSYPHGLVFYMDYKVSTTKKPLQSDYLNAGGVTGMDGNTFQSTSGYDQFYNNQNYDISKGKEIARGFNGTNYDNSSAGGVNDAGNSSHFLKTGVDLGGAGVSNIAIIDFDLSGMGFDMDSAASLKVYGVKAPGGVEGAALVQDVDFFVQRVPQNYAVDIMSTARTDVAGSAPGYNDGTASTAGRAANPTHNSVLRLRIIPTTTGLGVSNFKLAFKQYLNLELFPAFSSELKVEIVQVPITTQIHKLKTAWTVELAQDLMSYYAIDAEAELSQLLAEQIAGEKDRMIIRELVNLAAHFELWNGDFATVNQDPTTTVFRGIESGYNQGLVLAINRIDARIRKATKQGGANWILISAEGAAKLANLDTYKAFDMDEMGTKFALGVEKIGTLENKYQVYVDPNLPGHICLIGRKGSTFFDTGYVYAPYIEYILSPTVIEDQDFNPRKMISSRFGTKMLNNKFYGVVYMQGVGSFEVLQPSTTA
jgi:hypothetical protein